MPLPPPSVEGSAVESSRLETRIAGQRILVVDDNVDAAESLGALLRCLGAEVVTVHDGPAALEALRTETPAAAVLEGTITLSLDRFPAQVQRHLTVARSSLRNGRPQLAAAHDYVEYADRTSRLRDDGQLAFGYAGDLIGDQCSVPLRADTDTMLPPFLISTVPERKTSQR